MNLLVYDGFTRRLMFMFWTMVLYGPLHAQTDRVISIRMLDSKTGQVITKSEFMVWVDHQLGPGVRWIRQERDGIGEMTLSPTFNAKVMMVASGESVSTWTDECDTCGAWVDIMTIGMPSLTSLR